MSVEITGKNRLYSFFEILLDAIKFHGIFFGSRFLYHSLVIRFLLSPNKPGEYKLFGFRFKYLNKHSVLNWLFEIFGSNVYYFRTKTANPVIIDIGANIGDSVLYFKWLYPTAQIYAFEPNPDAFVLLEENIKINSLKDVETFNYALSNEEGSIDIFDDMSGVFNLTTKDANFLTGILSEESEQNDIKKFQVDVKRLSENQAFRNLEHIDLVKLDIEGAELSVLNDLEPFYNKIDNIILEYHLISNITENSFDNIVTQLRLGGFGVYISGSFRNSNNRTNKNVFMIMAFKK